MICIFFLPIQFEALENRNAAFVPSAWPGGYHALYTQWMFVELMNKLDLSFIIYGMIALG